jgi:Cof subfamily protein (haloacid dehalogenase superfamily)
LPFKLLALDVDGTLLRSDGTISPKTQSTLSRAVSNGLTLSIATGRRRRTAAPIISQLNLPHYLISSQGAVTWHENQIISHSHLPRAGARFALQQIHALGMSAVMFSNAEQPEYVWITGSWQTNQRLEVYTQRHPELLRELTDLEDLTGPSAEALAHDPIQLIVFDTMDRLNALAERLLAPTPPLDYRVIFSVNQFSSGGAIEVVGPNTSKAAALQTLCDRLGCTPQEVIAFGDNVNDVEMLDFAGLGVCMANGTPDARAAADRGAPSNDDDGIAVVLEELGLA